MRFLWMSDQPVTETVTYTTGNNHKRHTSMPSAGFFFLYERNTLFYHLNNITRSTTDFFSQLSHLQKTASQYTSNSAQMSYKHVLCVKKSQTTSASSPHLESIETMVGFEPSISAITRLPTYTLDHTATGIGDLVLCWLSSISSLWRERVCFKFPLWI